MNERILAKAREVLTQQGLDGAIITSPTNRRYLSGYSAEDHAPDESSGVILLGPNVAQIYASPNNTAWAASEAKLFEVLPWKQRPWESDLAGRIKAHGWKKIGFEDAGMIVGSQRRILDAEPSLDLQPLGKALDALRQFKTEDEVLTLQRAITLTDKVFETAIETLRAGETEAQIAWRIERICREETEGRIGFVSVNSGPN